MAKILGSKTQDCCQKLVVVEKIAKGNSVEEQTVVVVAAAAVVVVDLGRKDNFVAAGYSVASDPAGKVQDREPNVWCSCW